MIARRLLTQSGAVLAGSLLMGYYSRPLFAQPPGPADKQSILHVGPTMAIESIAESSILARAGDTIEVDAGVYTADVAV